MELIGNLQWIIIIVTIVGVLLTIFALIDILKSKFHGNDKIIWLLVVIFFNLFGVLLYFIIGTKQKIKA